MSVAKPIEYHNAIQGTNPWRRVFHYIVPVIIISVVFNTPKYFEIEAYEDVKSQNGGTLNGTIAEVMDDATDDYDYNNDEIVQG